MVGNFVLRRRARRPVFRPSARLSMVLKFHRSGGSGVDHALDYQSRDREIDPSLLRSFGSDFKPRSRLRMTSLLVGRYTRVHSLTHSLTQISHVADQTTGLQNEKSQSGRESKMVASAKIKHLMKLTFSPERLGIFG